MTGLPLWHGAPPPWSAPLDATACPAGGPTPTPAPPSKKRRDASAPMQTYPEFHNSPACRFAVFGLEIGGRWSTEAVTLIRPLAFAKTRSTCRWARQQAARAWPLSLAGCHLNP